MRKVAGLFAGIGGLELGFHKAGFGTSLLCELDSAAAAVLEEKFPGIPKARDVRELRQLPGDTAVLCAGFPCQDLSSSGQKAGITGEQSSLVSEVFRLLAVRPVEWVVIENVPFMLRLHKGRAMQEVVDGLEKLGYRWAYRVMDSQCFGVPHRRKRVYVVASLSGDPRSVLLSRDSPRFTVGPPDGNWGRARAIGFYWTEGTFSTGLAFNAIPPLKGGSTIGIPSPPAALLSSGHVVTPDIRDAERLQGFPPGWTVAAEREARSSIRWKLLGNAVTAHVATWVARRIADQIRRPKVYVPPRSTPMVLAKGWPDAGWGMQGHRYQCPLSHYPVRRTHLAYDQFLRFPGKLLSGKATRGFIARAEKGNLYLPAGFLDALAAHANSQV